MIFVIFETESKQLKSSLNFLILKIGPRVNE